MTWPSVCFDSQCSPTNEPVDCEAHRQAEDSVQAKVQYTVFNVSFLPNQFTEYKNQNLTRNLFCISLQPASYLQFKLTIDEESTKS